MNLDEARVGLNILIQGQFLVPVGIRTLRCPCRSQVTVYNCISLSIKNLMTLSTHLTVFYTLPNGPTQTRFRICCQIPTCSSLYVDPIATVSPTLHRHSYAQVVPTGRHLSSTLLFPDTQRSLETLAPSCGW